MPRPWLGTNRIAVIIYSINMKLLLTSAGITNHAIRTELERLLGKSFEEASCVLVPTAIHAERGDKRWKLSNSAEIMAINWKKIEIVDIAVSSKQEFAHVVRSSDAVIFGGGNPNFLYAKITEKFSNQEFKALMTAKVWVGISAGSMITSPRTYFDRAWEFYGEQKEEDNEGLGWIDFYTLPHFDGNDFARKICSESGEVVYALGDENALSIDSLESQPRIIEEPRWETFGI